MKRFRRILQRLFFPKVWFVLFSTFAGAALLVYTFACGHKEDWTAIPSYLFSAYAMVLVCIRLQRLSGHARKDMQTVMEKVPLVHRYCRDASFRVHSSLYFSLGLNVVYAVIKFMLGLRYHSVWFGTLAVYYFLLAVMRFLLLSYITRKGFGTNRKGELHRYRLCGAMLVVMNSAFTGMVVLVLRENEGFRYAGYLIYVMALYAFYNIIIAVVNVIRYRKYNSPVMSAAKGINLAAALVSMLSLETAMLAQFGDTDSEMFRHVMTACTGAGVCTIILEMAVYMMHHATRELNGIQKEETR